MKITSFHPLIVSEKGEEVIELFEALGFEKRHVVKEILGQDITNTTMRDANGFNIDVTSVPQMPQDMTLIRMNVDDFDEAYEMLLARGFKASAGGNEKAVETKHAMSARMISPSGFMFDLCQHVK